MTDTDTFRQRGYLVVRDALSPYELIQYRAMLIALSGIDPSTYVSEGRGTSSWNFTDGVTKHQDFWGLIHTPRLIESVESAIGPGFKYLQHSDLQVGFSAVAWHRDNVNRTYGIGPDWDESDGPYGLVRVGIYLQSHADSGFRLGLIPGSHRVEGHTHPLVRSAREWKFRLQGALAFLGPRFQGLTRSADWIATEPGDAIVFDPRILHSGSYIDGLKLSMFVGYGQQNRHFADLQNYYRNIRTELGYRPLSPEFAAFLDRHDLLADPIPELDRIEGAYVPPSLLRKVVERRIGSTSK